MANLSTHGFRLIDSFKRDLHHPVIVERVNDFVYAFDLPQTNLLVLYYMPAAGLKVHDYPTKQTEKKIIHIDEDIWLYKPVLVLSRIKVILGMGERIYARQCVVARIDKKTALYFQEEHHLQESIPGKYRYGLFFEGELMAVMVFSGGRIMKHTADYRSFECLRFCSKQGLVIIGGFSKLIQAFVKDFHPNDVMTYVDKDWSDGSKFESMGFVRILDTIPQCFWVSNETKERISIKVYEKLDAFAREHFYEVCNSGSIKMIQYLHP